MNSRKYVVIGNWKMNKNFTETMDFLLSFKEEYKKLKKNNKEAFAISQSNDFAIALPHANLSAYQINKVKELKLSAQDVSQNNNGAFTGDISATMLQDLNVSYVILGHSERRQNHNESNNLVNLKAKQALNYNITPVICVGESFEQYEKGETKEVVRKQIEESLSGLDYSKIIVAYEPIWAIGTGKVATPEIAQDVCEFIHSITSDKLVVQYGGSVSPSNIAELAKQKDINGFLVGGASLNVDSFIKLITLGN
ncbi:triose-phosphate isomerase [Mycoplasmopsis caviae]|uniref:Triosephosphate isomerase n=1 Tax=Mycoplasmopsis caviae TaxID=55603 RepID=A0A3P8L6G6_9BACT|nr:triose-phosphate isomerase [Mycoplasmopsis caviae]UUD35679.1 triose-phosphate isomerase [Mycoplasmopsis caviae]VDR41575.1 Triosephosphate isomerase [Mycoplasmopsis caviae]